MLRLWLPERQVTEAKSELVNPTRRASFLSAERTLYTNPQKYELDFEEYFLFVKEIEEKPADSNEREVVQDLYPIFRKEADDATEEEIGGKSEIDDRLRHVNSDGIEADDGEKECPATETANIDDPIEQSEKQQTQTSCKTDVWTAPYGFIYGENETPHQSERHKSDAGNGHVSGFLHLA